eukprot:8841187-Pyramimonas_sp.AAC.1
MEANMQAAVEARRAARDRNMRTTPHIANRSARRGHVPTPLSNQSSRDGPPPPSYKADESTLQRQERTRPNSDTPVVSDISFTQCA